MEKNRSRKIICTGLAMALVFGLAGCGKENVDVSMASVITSDNQEAALSEILNGQVRNSHSSEAGKEETVYVFADAKGSVNQVIVSDWLKNSEGGNSLKDISDLKNIENVKGYETFETDADGNMIWQAQGADIYYRGDSDKEVPVEVKLSYKLDGNDISPEELAGKSGRVTIRMDYENKETRKVNIGNKEEEIKVPFVMISGMVLPQDVFSNIEVTNARLMSEGENSIVVGLAFPGFEESIDFEGLKDKISDEEAVKKAEEMEIPDYIEVTADATDFKLDMTMTVAMSDILSDIELADSIDLSSLTDSMDELRDATDQLEDGTTQLKDGSSQLKDGTKELLDGAVELDNGASELKDGTQELYEKSGTLGDGVIRLDDGAVRLNDGLIKLNEGANKLGDGAIRVDDGAQALYSGTVSLGDGASKLKAGADQLQSGGQKLLYGTENLVAGMERLDSGAGQVSAGVEQMAGQMNTLKGYIGTTGTSAQAGATPTLLQLSAGLNQNIKVLSNMSDEQYRYIQTQVLESLMQQKAAAQDGLNSAQTNLAAAQSKARSAQADMTAACQLETREVEVVAANGHTDTVSQNDVVRRSTVQVQSMDTNVLQQKTEAYQNALQEVSACQAEVTAYSMQVAALDDAIAAAGVSPQADHSAMWTQTVTYGITLQAMLTEISETLNSAESTQKMTALVNGAGELADGTHSALAGAKELNGGAKELKSGLDSLENGAGELSGGIGSLKSGAETLKNGTGELRKGAGELRGGSGDLRKGAGELKDGTNELRDGTEQLVTGTNTLNDGAGELRDGIRTLKDGVVTLDEGAGTLDEGVLELLEGLFEFDEEGISRLTELFGDDVQDVVDRLKAVADSGKDYNTFTDLPEGMDGSVKFIIKTEGIG